MKAADIGDVVVCDHGKVWGIVTDRDLVVRAMAEGTSPDQVRLRDVCSHELHHDHPGCQRRSSGASSCVSRRCGASPS